MLDFLQRMTCRHVWTWSERRQVERCYRCRATRTPPPVAAPPVTTSRPPPPLMVYSPGPEDETLHFHPGRLHARLVVDRPAGAPD